MKRYLLCLLLACATARANEIPVEHITYDEFIHAVEAGKVTELHFYDLAGIEGTMTSPTGVVHFDTAPGVRPATDPLLLRLLKSHGLKFSQSEEPKYLSHQRGYSSLDLMELGLLLITAVLVIAVIQLTLLRRLSKNSAPLAPGPQSGFTPPSARSTLDVPAPSISIRIRRLRSGAVFQLVFLGTAMFFVPMIALFGLLALFGAHTVNVGNKPVTGLAGLLVALVLAPICTLLFSAFGWVAAYLGIRLFGAFRPITLEYVPATDSLS